MLSFDRLVSKMGCLWGTGVPKLLIKLSRISHWIGVLPAERLHIDIKVCNSLWSTVVFISLSQD
jgi:hypothetical protein